MTYKEQLLIFDEKFKEVRRKTSSLSEEANQMIAHCTGTLNNLKKLVLKEGFKSRDAEIYFFREIKVAPMQYLIYYTEIRSCELRMPKIGQQSQMIFLEKQVDKVNRFFGKHTEFLIYLDQGYDHFDKHYFTRKYVHYSPVAKSYPYFKDHTFNTSHDGLLARIRGLGLYSNYLREKKKELERKDFLHKQKPLQTDIQWTGTYAAFVEMIYGCEAMGHFNNGRISIGKIIEELGTFLKVERGNYSRTYNELKNRKQSRIKFFEDTGQKLLEKMNEEDGHLSNT